MTEREYPGPDEQATHEQGTPGVEPSAGSAGSASGATDDWPTDDTTGLPETEPTRPYGASFGQVDPSWPQPQVAPAPAGYPVPGQAPAGYPVDYPAEYPAAPSTETAAPSGTSRLPGWTWPLISVLALVLGLAGGAIAGSLVSSDHGSSSGGVLSVQRRTAAPLPADSNSVAAVSAKVLPSTVQIIAEYNGKAQGATGSGFVFDKQGHVITNNHVVAEAAGDNGPIEVIDHDGRHMKASVVGRSAVYDIAVLEVKGAETLPPAALGSAQQMRVGETVVAFGSPLGLSATVTSGIISAVNRPVTTGDGSDSSYINAVQTDAAINPGNSGGPLVNLQGEVIGVNSAIASLGSSVTSDQGGNIGVGFAIPIEQVLVTTDQILRTGHAEYPIIGANVRGTQKLDGATVESIAAGSPASKTELKVGDVIVKVDGKPVTGSSDVVVAVRAHQPGESVELTVKRGSKTLEITVGLIGKTG
ncbi:S1C family serine protease [Nocardioides pocheonensis]|uniref:S1C family serine protease n=1 Tax=Nocardioides pocheonensis TaxID=661485 RepID=UPI001610E786|nr:trypsin-like peptidase domain-containing protein [Nocardioides pocheonensis]